MFIPFLCPKRGEGMTVRVKIGYWLLATSFWLRFSFGFVPQLGMDVRMKESEELILKLNQVNQGIRPLDAEAQRQALRRLDSLLKPIGSLGKLESIAAQIAGITGKVANQLTRKCVIVMCADNGVWEEGVSACPQELTAMQTLNFTRGICGINVLCRHAGMDVKIIDIGVNADLNHPEIINRKIRKGTGNIAKGPAITREEAVKAIEAGIETVAELTQQGYDTFGTGEMGIANTSTSSAVLMAFTGCDAVTAVGKGAGLTEADYMNKKRVIELALRTNLPDPADPLDVLAKVGGLDIAGLTGCYLGAAYHRVPIIIDGFISAAAALTAFKLNPLAREYMIPSHSSAEPGFGLIMKEMGLKPMLNLEMRLGEGTGCPLAFNIMDAATKIITEMATFEEAAVKDDFLVDIRKG
jgi:nicotinate-nucleotide--dimethylbenzimidazole phosphoribosyltransferase